MSAIAKRLIAPLARRLRLMVARGAVELVNDSLKCQGLQLTLLSDEVQDDVERFQEYGLTSVPFPGADVLFLSVGGNRSHGIVACVSDRRYRPTDLNEGDCCLFTDRGERVYLDRVADVVRIGDKTAAEFLLLGTKFRTEQTTLNTALQTGLTAIGTGFTALGVVFTALSTGFPVMIVAPLPAPAITAGGVAAAACGVAAAACTAAAGACSTAASAVGTFESSGAPDNYLSSKAATIA